jgi:hypothetical protein
VAGGASDERMRAVVAMHVHNNNKNAAAAACFTLSPPTIALEWNAHTVISTRQAQQKCDN